MVIEIEGRQFFSVGGVEGSHYGKRAVNLYLVFRMSSTPGYDSLLCGNLDWPVLCILPCPPPPAKSYRCVAPFPAPHPTCSDGLNVYHWLA